MLTTQSTHEDLRKAIQEAVDAEVRKDSGLLKRDRGKAAALIEGVLSRQSDLYALSEDEYDDSRPTVTAVSTSYGRHHSRSRFKYRRENFEHDPVKNRDNAYYRVEEYIETHTVKSASLWNKVEQQIQERYSNSNGSGANGDLLIESTTSSSTPTKVFYLPSTANGPSDPS